MLDYQDFQVIRCQIKKIFKKTAQENFMTSGDIAEAKSMHQNSSYMLQFVFGVLNLEILYSPECNTTVM